MNHSKESNSDNYSQLVPSSRKGSRFKNGDSQREAKSFSMHGDKDKSQPKPKRLKTWHKVLIGVGIPLAIIIALGICVLSYMHSINAAMAIDDVELAALQRVLVSEPSDPKEPYYVLILGSDARPDDTTSRSDTIMLCRLDPANKRVSILSIPRDTKIELEGYGTQKINAAMAYGGPAGAARAVSDFVGVDISHVVMIDFEGFKGIVDALGGVTINVPYHTEFASIVLEPGVQKLNGNQALGFARCRYSYVTGDFQRAANQRQLVKVVAKDILKAPVTQVPGLLRSFAGCMSTDMKAIDLIGLANDFRGMDIDADMYTGQVPSTTATIDGISYVLTLDEQWAEVREKFVNGEVPFVDTSNQPQVVD